MTGLELEGYSQQAGVFGGQSMIGHLRRVLMRMPSEATGVDDWKRYGYSRPVDNELARQEHADLVGLLAGQGVDVVLAGKDDSGDLDAIFTYDPSLITDAGAILLSMGKELRAGEPAAHGETWTELGIPVLGEVVAPGQVEGGDAFWLDDLTMAIGRGYRTNDDGIRQLRVLLGAIGVELIQFDLPHWTGRGDCLHLLSLISPVAERTAVVHRPLMAVSLIDELNDRDWTLIDIPADEFATMGCNVLTLEPGKVVMVEGNPGTRTVLERCRN